MNTILLGPLLGNNRAQLIERCAQLVAENRSNSFVYLAASHPLLEVVTQGILDGTKNRGVWGELPVYLFRGFVRKIISTAQDEHGNLLPPRIPIDREELPLRRSLVSQILAQLLTAGKLKALEPLARREGCVNTIATLIGEIQRSAKTPAEVSQIIASRAADVAPMAGPNTQIDFDKEVGLIYSTYFDLLTSNQLTEDDNDQLRALRVLQGEIEGINVNVPWLRNVELLVLDGFFDFTPVQGAILRELIPQIPETVVNLNHDQRNPEIFKPFQETVAQLEAITSFETIQNTGQKQTNGVLGFLRENLFNPEISESTNQETQEQPHIHYFECGDRDTEIRTIAREIKRLVLLEKYNLADIALVVRQRASYAQTIARVMKEEGVPCSLEFRVESVDVPATRAVLKLLELLEKPQTQESPGLRLSDLADLIKSEYFRLGDEELETLSAQFNERYTSLLSDSDNTNVAPMKRRYRIGFWDADSLENAFAYVGSDLPVGAWLARAEKLIKELPQAEATKELLNIDAAAPDRDADISDQIENAETAKVDDAGVEKKRRPSRDVHPASLAWAALVIQRFSELIVLVPREGRPADLRHSLMRLLDQFCFRDQIVKPIRSSKDTDELPQILLNFNALESLRRALVAAIKSIEMSDELQLVANSRQHSTPLSTFIAESHRALNSQSQVLSTADRGGLRVLEATDVRGLRFRAVFVAGLIEGGFPLRVSRDWIYPHEERERLKHYGLALEDISPATLLKEEHYFYQSACRATDRLYLTRPLVLEDDSETVASYYIDELRRAIAPFELTSETVRRDYDGKEIEESSSADELRVALVRQQQRNLQRAERQRLLVLPQIKRLLTLARNDGYISDLALRRIEIERERAGPHFGAYDGVITDPQLLQLLQKKFGPEYVYSASGLSKFGNCAYSFFAQRVLKLEPRGEAALDLQAIDAGKLLHDILRRFFERHRREFLRKADLQNLRAELLHIADEVFDQHERVVPPLNRQIWKIDREIRKILLEQVLRYELDIQEEGQVKGVLPAYFEIAFGGSRSSAKDPDSTDQPLELTRDTFVGTESIKFNGQIDRVDVADDDTLVAYDYKLSQGSSKEDIRTGRNLQIPIYLEALEKVILPGHEIAGGGYYTIRGGKDRRNKGLHRASKKAYYNLKSNVNAIISDDEWQQIRAEVIAKLWDFVDQIRAGKFLVNPSERTKTCRFCDFSAMCRYNRDRIEPKRWQ
ncbi:MAG: hypothetical protein C5B55_13380 [Blastocatellia bacterium]|nr:MAG: hypothetical protein C5B55_13380 [Blastocatellia bacterium]